MLRNLPPFIPSERFEYPYLEEPWKIVVGEWEGTETWSNGHLMIKEPLPAKYEGTAERVPFERAIEKLILDAPEIFPIAACKASFSPHLLVWFSADLCVRASYYYDLIERFPDAQIYGLPEHALLFRIDGKLVAALMPLRINFGYEAPTQVAALLQRANAGEPQPTFDGPEEPQPKKD
jgi:hypothetical protein